MIDEKQAHRLMLEAMRSIEERQTAVAARQMFPEATWKASGFHGALGVTKKCKKGKGSGKGKVSGNQDSH